MCYFIVEATDADVVAYEPIWLGDNVAGFCTSGGFSHWTGQSVAYGFLPVDTIRDGMTVEIEILGKRCAAHLTSEPLWDPNAERMRG